ncbi:hypothetical protein [Frigoriflavimonas asaccharolytica]|uniref:Uncharacterized protein n=1 Tax=Frigoriflavimonas asaccharolytica TaxID=2735899 RepID=A0A8J8G952_9FLAO|nr:hypothetical protein [Frigoriflavimonas asaccharolytica]NRS93748.1 hypothetical protein [Frigoriflavimonas asaccharolytica]
MIYELFSSSREIEEVVIISKRQKVSPSNSEEPISPIKRFWPQGEYIVSWDGFDINNIYDSALMKSENGLNVSVTGQAEFKKKSFAIEKPIKFTHKKVDWVDVKIDGNNLKIETTLRVNLKDGGEEGLDCRTRDIDPDPKIRVPLKECDWDKIPSTSIIAGKPIIKTRTKSFADLEKLAIDGLNYHWGRNKNHAEAKDVKIADDSYEVFINTVNTTEKTMDDVDLLYNTNYFWGRSNNPGCVSGFKSFLANLAQYIPYVPLSETIYYNIGYVNNVYKAESHFLFKESWFYIDNVPLYKNGKSKVDMEYAYTCAHEIGHTLLRSYSEGGGGSADYSYKHKGSSGYSDTKPLSEGGVSYPTEGGEIDLMKYYNNSPRNFLDYDYERIVAEDKDVLGLIWLTKLKTYENQYF